MSSKPRDTDLWGDDSVGPRARVTLDEQSLESIRQYILRKTVVKPNPMAAIQHAGLQSIPTGGFFTGYLVTFDTMFFDTHKMVDLDNDRIVIRTPGFYKVTAQCTFAPGAGGGFRGMLIALDGNAARYVYQTSNITVEDMLQTSTTFKLSLNQYLQLVVAQNSGAALDIYGNNFGQPHKTELFAELLFPTK